MALHPGVISTRDTITKSTRLFTADFQIVYFFRSITKQGKVRVFRSCIILAVKLVGITIKVIGIIATSWGR